jgi:hypothetical protein
MRVQIASHRGTEAKAARFRIGVGLERPPMDYLKRIISRAGGLAGAAMGILFSWFIVAVFVLLIFKRFEHLG